MSTREFEEVFKVGKRTHFPHLMVITAPADTRAVSAVVGKKVARSAVRRNTLRRRIYAVLKDVLEKNRYTDALIVITKPTFNSLTRSTAEDFVRESIEQVLKTP